MKSIKSLVVVFVAVSVFGMVSSVMAAEAGAVTPEKKVTKAALETITVTGKVNVMKDAKGGVTGVELTAVDGAVYQVRMNPKGKALGKDHEKTVEATGTVTEMGGKKVLRVKSCKVVEETLPPSK